MTSKPLLVVPNPYSSLDEDGDPCGYVLRVDLRKHSATPILLGAQRVFVNGKIKIRFDDTPVEIPDLPVYRRLLTNRELLPADQATAQRVGLLWQPVSNQLDLQRSQAAQQFLAHTGELPSWAMQEETS